MVGSIRLLLWLAALTTCLTAIPPQLPGQTTAAAVASSPPQDHKDPPQIQQENHPPEPSQTPQQDQQPRATERFQSANAVATRPEKHAQQPDPRSDNGQNSSQSLALHKLSATGSLSYVDHIPPNLPSIVPSVIVAIKLDLADASLVTTSRHEVLSTFTRDTPNKSLMSPATTLPVSSQSLSPSLLQPGALPTEPRFADNPYASRQSKSPETAGHDSNDHDGFTLDPQASSGQDRQYNTLPTALMAELSPTPANKASHGATSSAGADADSGPSPASASAIGVLYRNASTSTPGVNSNNSPVSLTKGLQRPQSFATGLPVAQNTDVRVDMAVSAHGGGIRWQNMTTLGGGPQPAVNTTTSQTGNGTMWAPPLTSGPTDSDSNITWVGSADGDMPDCVFPETQNSQNPQRSVSTIFSVVYSTTVTYSGDPANFTPQLPPTVFVMPQLPRSGTTDVEGDINMPSSTATDPRFVSTHNTSTNRTMPASIIDSDHATAPLTIPLTTSLPLTTPASIVGSGQVATPLTTPLTTPLPLLPFGSTMLDSTSVWCYAHVPPLMPLNRLTVSVPIINCWATSTDATTCVSTNTDASSAFSAISIYHEVEYTTVLVTAKGTAVVLPSPTPMPDYGGAGQGGQWSSYVNQHSQPSNDKEPFTAPFYPQVMPTNMLATLVPVIISMPPGSVVMDGHTYTDDARTPTKVVTVAGNTFTIDPSHVVGLGASLNRPATGSLALPLGIFVAVPTSAVVGGLSVVVSGSVASIDGTSFSLPPQPSAVVIHGTQTVYLGPNAVNINGATMALTPMIVSAALGSPSSSGGSGSGGGGFPMSEVVVAGGELITAIGPNQVVIQGHTLTYGSPQPGPGQGVPAMATPTVTSVAGELITLSPDGVIVHGTTLGGVHAPPGQTQYQLVGGATFTEVDASVFIFSGQSFTLGPSAVADGNSALAKTDQHVLTTPMTTTLSGGTVMTMGPGGITIGSLTFSAPFGPVVTLTPSAAAASGAQSSQRISRTTAATQPPATTTAMLSHTSTKNGASGSAVPPPPLRAIIFLSFVLSFCIATGVRLGLFF